MKKNKIKHDDEKKKKLKSLNLLNLYNSGVPGPSCSTNGPLKRCMTVCLRYTHKIYIYNVLEEAYAFLLSTSRPPSAMRQQFPYFLFVFLLSVKEAQLSLHMKADG
jgi:hypothetical protein